jgi:nitroreductase
MQSLEISHDIFPFFRYDRNNEKGGLTMDFNALSVRCRTYRKFTQEEIPEEILMELMENVRIVSSAMNGQVLRYVLVKDSDLVAKMQPMIHWAAALPKELGTPKAGEQPTAFILVCKEGKGNAWADIDVGIAVRNIALNAMSHGIGSAILGAVEFPKVTELLKTPENWNPRLLIALGYPGVESRIVEVPESGSIKYYLDENRNYCVPKRKLGDILVVK